MTLVLKRHEQERIRLRLPDGADIWITVVEACRGVARLGIDAPAGVLIHREEIIGRTPAPSPDQERGDHERHRTSRGVRPAD